jgi:hypothetical protein
MGLRFGLQVATAIYPQRETTCEILKSSDADFHNNPGGVLRDLGRPSDATSATARRCVRIRISRRFIATSDAPWRLRGNSTAPQTACARRFG